MDGGGQQGPGYNDSGIAVVHGAGTQSYSRHAYVNDSTQCQGIVGTTSDLMCGCEDIMQISEDAPAGAGGP